LVQPEKKGLQIMGKSLSLLNESVENRSSPVQKEWVPKWLILITLQFINGYQLPDLFQAGDIKYLI